ncbi:hypothetical protein HCU40_01585 [Pseudanabaena biceps]|nr:hypothetical protein [Pseudanabaena biceps]
MKFRSAKDLITKKVISTGLVNVIASLVTFGFSSSGAMAIGIAISGITTTTTFNGTDTQVTNVNGATSEPNSDFSNSNSYTVNFAEEVRAITSITTSDGTYGPVGIPLNVVVKRNGSPANNIFYSPGTASGTTSGSTISVKSGNALSLTQEQILTQNNINLGSDNVFTNFASGGLRNNNNNNNIERIDFISSTGFSASIFQAFSIIERGAGDAFRIAAITELNAGNPSNYGALVDVTSGYNSAPTLGLSSTYVVFRNGQPSANISTSQDLRGILIKPVADLGVTAGGTIYGFSLFAPDTTGSGTQLADVTNTTFFPANTSDGNGGIDLLAGNVGVVAVPFDFEPQFGLIVLGGAWFVRRQLRKKTSK